MSGDANGRVVGDDTPARLAEGLADARAEGARWAAWELTQGRTAEPSARGPGLRAFALAHALVFFSGEHERAEPQVTAWCLAYADAWLDAFAPAWRAGGGDEGALRNIRGDEADWALPA